MRRITSIDRITQPVVVVTRVPRMSGCMLPPLPTSSYAFRQPHGPTVYWTPGAPLSCLILTIESSANMSQHMHLDRLFLPRPSSPKARKRAVVPLPSLAIAFSPNLHMRLMLGCLVLLPSSVFMTSTKLNNRPCSHPQLLDSRSTCLTHAFLTSKIARPCATQRFVHRTRTL